MSALGALATGAVKAMMALYEKKYGTTTKHIKKLQIELSRSETKITKLRSNVAVLMGQLEQLRDEVEHWSAKYTELVDIALQPVELDDNPYVNHRKGKSWND